MDYFIFLFFLFALLMSVAMAAGWWAWDSNYKGARWRSFLLFLSIMIIPVMISALSIVFGYVFRADGYEPKWLLPTGLVWVLLYLGSVYVVGGNFKFTRASHAIYAEKHPPKWSAKKAWIASACFLLCTLLTFGLLQSRAMDRLESMEQQTFEYLKGVYPKPVADADNAYLVFEQASKLLKKENFDGSLYTDLLEDKKSHGDASVEKELNKHQEALRLIRKGAEMKQWSININEVDANSFIDKIRWLDAFNLLGSDALYQMHIGNIQSALGDLHTLSRLVSSLQTRPDLVGQALVSHAMKRIFDVKERLMGRGHDIAGVTGIIPATPSKSANERFRNAVRDDPVLAGLDVLSALKEIVEAWSISGVLYAIGGLNYDYDYLHTIYNRTQESAKGTVLEANKSLNRLSQMIDGKQTDQIGIMPTIMNDGPVSIGSGWLLRIVEADARLALLKLAVAADAYHHDHGSYPKAAVDLIPGYLDAVPLDPFDRQPLRFKASDNGLLLYSIGMNLKDDGALPSKEHMSGDLVFCLGKAYLTHRVSLEKLVRVEDMQGLKQMLAAGFDVNTVDKDGRSPLFFAEKQAIAELLIRHGANVNAVDKDGQSPLFFATSPATAAQLISHGADVNARDKRGLTPLLALSGPIGIPKRGDGINDGRRGARAPDVLRMLLDHGADVAAKDQNGFTALFGRTGDSGAELLIAHGADVNARSKSGMTPLFTNFGATDVLVKLGADVQVVDNEGNTPVLYNRKVWRVVLDLAKHGARMDAIAKDGSTPISSNLGYPSVVEKLLKSGVIASPQDCEAIKKMEDGNEYKKRNFEEFKSIFAEHGGCASFERL